MKLLSIESRNVVAILELSLEELEDLEIALSLTKIDYNGEDEQESKSVNYLTNLFFPAITDLIKKIKGVVDGDR